MNRKQLGILLVLAAVIVGAGVVLHRNRNASWEQQGDATAGTNLLGDFPINDITRIAIRHGTNEVNLVKKDDLWRVSERGDYPANFSQIGDFLIKARDLKIVQSEKVGASQLARLDLATTGQGTNIATVIEFKGANDKPIKTLFLGKPHLQKSTQTSPYGGGGSWPDGRYVKVGDSANVALISDPLDTVKPQPDTWLDKDFFHVEKPKSIEVRFPVATNSWKLTRESETGSWKLADAGPDEKLDTSKISGVSSPFSSPSFNDVLPGVKLDGSGKNAPTAVNISTFDGFNYTIHAGSKTNDDYLLTVAVNADLPKERVPGKDEKPADKAKLDKEFKDKQQKLENKLKQEQGYEKWTYLVPAWTVDPVLKERSQLLVEKKGATNSVSKAETSKIETAASAVK